ncbi:MAG: HAMP domain-containing protein [Deltaproteobacteria bacterium]|nr:HAMP domain-containing protein [Deltaproteobacteria bacterium]
MSRPWRTRLSLRSRLIGLHIVLFSGVLLAGPAMYVVMSQALDRELDEYLDSLSALLAREYARTEGGGTAPSGTVNPCLPAVATAPGTDSPGMAHLPRHMLVADGDGRVLCSDGESSPLAPEALRRSQSGGVPVRSEFTRARETLRLVTRTFTDGGGRRLVMEVGASHTVIERALKEGAVFLVAGGLVAFVLFAMGSYVIAGRAVAPIDRVIRSVEQIDKASLAERLSPEDSIDEVGRLTAVINHMLERLEKAFESQRRFVSDVAHEIRSPLTALRGQIEVALRKERPSEEYRAVLNENLEEVLRLSRIAEDLMSMARADAGVLQIQREKIDLCDFLAGVVRRFKGRADEKNIRLEFVPAAEPIAVSGDPDWLGRLVENLLDNAILHAPQMGRVAVSLRGADRFATIAVEDNGPGIAAEHLPHIFDRFYRADPSRSREGGGAGLGLAIARQIAVLHGGTIGVASTVGKGSVLTVELPAVPE